MAGEDGPTQVIEPLAASPAEIALPHGLGVVVPVLGDHGGAALGARHAVGPAHGPDSLEALGVVDQGLDVDHRRASLGSEPIVSTAESTPEMTLPVSPP